MAPFQTSLQFNAAPSASYPLSHFTFRKDQVAPRSPPAVRAPNTGIRKSAIASQAAGRSGACSVEIPLLLKNEVHCRRRPPSIEKSLVRPIGGSAGSLVPRLSNVAETA